MSPLTKIVGYVLLGVAIFINSGCSSEKNAWEDPNLEKTYDGDSTDLKHTIIVPTLDSLAPKGNSVIWCSSFQIAWNQLRDGVIGRPIQVIGAEEIAKSLNTSGQSLKDVPRNSYYAASGFVKDKIVERIQAQMSERFPDAPKPQFEGMSPTSIIAYSYLASSAKFRRPFFENHKKFVFKDSLGNEVNVTSFGIRPEDDYAYDKLRKQVKVLFYKQERSSEYLTEYAIELCKYSKPNKIVIARIQPRETLALMLEDLEQKIADFPKHKIMQRFGINDVLLVPNMFWQVTHHFEEIEGKFLGNLGYQTYWFKEAMQMIQFRLDRSGAELKSEAKIPVAPVPKHFIVDGPFLIYMKKRGAKYPFFVMWVDNAELLSKP